MSSGIYTSMMGARAQEHALESINNNLANVNTPGFKRQETLYREVHGDVSRMDDPLQGEDIHSPVRFLPDDRIAGVMEQRFTHFEQGPLKPTGNPLDLAIEGDGFFVVQGPDGLRFTRNGTFTRQPDGLITTVGGDPVLDDQQRSIRIPESAGLVTVTSEGQIQAGNGMLARLGLVRFDDPRLLERAGDSEWRLTSPRLEPRPVDAPSIHQGWLEASNVNAVSTMTLMVKVSRLFELNSKVIQAYKQMDQEASQEVGRAVS